MATAVSLGAQLQAVGAGAAAAAHSLPSVAAGGMQAVTTTASTAAASLPGALPASLPQAVNAGAAGTAQLANDLALVEKPAKAVAAGVPRSSLVLRAAGFLSKALPLVTIGASSLAGAQIVSRDGADALVGTKDGRGAVLGAAGGVLLLIPHPASQLAAAGMLGAVAANHFGGMERIDRGPAAAAR